MIKYFQGGYDEAKLYTPNSHVKLYFKCPDCGKVKDKLKSIHDLFQDESIGCACSDGISYPNKFAYALLKQLDSFYNFNYLESEYSPNWIKPKRYDFYFEYDDKKYILEMDGRLGHGKYNKLNNQTSKETKAIDTYKDKMAQDNNIEVIRIDCEISDFNYIKSNIMNSKLSNIFDLTNIDWLKCQEFALSNLVKMACDYKKDNPNLSTTDIGKLMNLNNQTIRNYLIQGSDLGWCNYNSKEERIKANNKSVNITKKPVEIFKNNISLGVFESVSELERQSERLFGIRLVNQGISEVCRNETTKYKNFTFKYVDNI